MRRHRLIRCLRLHRAKKSVDGLRKTGRIDDFFFKLIHGLGLGNLGRFSGAYSQPFKPAINEFRKIRRRPVDCIRHVVSC